MSSDELLSRGRLRAMQIVAGALLAGQVMFAGIVLFLAYGRDDPLPQPLDDRLPIISILAGAMLLVTGSLSFVLPGILTQNGLKQLAAGPEHDDQPRLLALMQSSMIVGLALLEGAAFFGLIAFMVERQSPVLAVPGLALAAMVLRFPTENGVRNWMEMSARRVLELRQDRPSV